MPVVAYNPFRSYPSQPVVVKVLPPIVALAQSSDSGAIGDQITTFKNARFDVSGLRSTGFAWLSLDNNGTFDSGDIPVIGGGVS